MVSKSTLDLVERLKFADDGDAFWKICHDALEAQGVKSMCYGIIPFAGEIKAKGFTAAGFFKMTHTDEWIETIGEKHLFDEELTTEIMVERPETIIWQDESLWEDATPEQMWQCDVEREMGLDVGVTFALAHNEPDVASVGVGLNMPDIGKKDFLQYWDERQDKIQMICTLLDNGMRKKHGNAIARLTNRERDVLTLFAIGMQRDGVAYRLGLSEKTVDHHVRTAKAKLNAGTTAHAVAKALVIGAIHP